MGGENSTTTTGDYWETTDTKHYEGVSTERVIAPAPLGKMGARMLELAAEPVAHRAIDLYARLAEVAR